MLGTVKRLAGSKLAKAVASRLGNTIRSGPKSNLAADIAMQFGPDAAFGVLQGAMTPGDLNEKIISGTSTALGGAVGGLGLSAALPKGMRNNQAVRLPVELIGGFAGDAAGQGIGDAIMRATSKDGKTPYERVAEDERRKIEQQTLAALGLGGYNVSDLAGMM